MQSWKIIDSVQTQKIYMEMVQRLKPERVILGKKLFDILTEELLGIFVSDSKNHDDSGKILGLPITIDYKNVWMIMVCSGVGVDGKSLLDLE